MTESAAMGTITVKTGMNITTMGSVAMGTIMMKTGMNITMTGSAAMGTIMMKTGMNITTMVGSVAMDIIMAMRDTIMQMMYLQVWELRLPISLLRKN